MSWYAMAVRWWADEDVEATGAQWAWPFILDAIKTGNGVASARALSDDRLARCAGLTGFLALDENMVVAEYSRVGLVVAVDGGWTARSWDEYQRADEAKRERQKRYRERKKAGNDVATTTPRRNDDASATPPRRNGDGYSTVHDIQDRTTGVAVVEDPSRATLPDPATTTTAATTEAAELIELWVQTQAGTGSRAPGMFASHAAQAAIVELVATHKAERVRWAIGRAVEIATRGAPSLGMLRKLCEEGPLPERPAGQSFSAPKPQRPHSSAGTWAKFGMAIPEPNRGTDGEV